MINIIELIENNDWNNAKKLWILNVLKIYPDQVGYFNLEGDQFDMCDRFLISGQKYTAYINCLCCSYTERVSNDKIFFREYTIFSHILITIKNQVCTMCDQVVQVHLDSFMYPPYLVIQNADQAEITLSDLENIFEINGTIYELVFFTFFNQYKRHYYAVVNICNTWFLIDDLNSSVISPFAEQKQIYKVYSCFYLMIN